MYLIIDLSVDNTIQLALFSLSDRRETIVLARNTQLLFCIKKFLDEQGLSFSDLRGVAVVVGEGGFTSTRLSVVIGNMIAFTCGIPILAVTAVEAREKQRMIERLLEQPFQYYIIPTYSAAPRVMQP